MHTVSFIRLNYELNARRSLGVLIKIVREHQMEFVVQKLIDFSGSKDEELRDIAGLGEPPLH